MTDELIHRATIQLQHTDIWDLDGRQRELQDIKEWLDALVDWQPNCWEWVVLHSRNEIDVWFRKEKHAVMCILRWA